MIPSECIDKELLPHAINEQDFALEHTNLVKKFLTCDSRVASHRIATKSCLSFILFINLHLWLPPSSFSQISSQQQQNAGSKENFSYSITSQYGVQTSGSATANMVLDNRALLIIAPNSTITNKIGGSDGKSSFNFDSTSTGANLNINGLTGQNNWIIQQAEFSSTLKTADNLTADQQKMNQLGNGSALGVHTTTLNIEKSNSSFQTTFNQSF